MKGCGDIGSSEEGRRNRSVRRLREAVGRSRARLGRMCRSLGTWLARLRSGLSREAKVAALKRKLRSERALYAEKLQARDDGAAEKIASLHRVYRRKLEGRDAVYRRKLADRDRHLAKLQARIEAYQQRLLDRDVSLGRMQDRIDGTVETVERRSAAVESLSAQIEMLKQKLLDRAEGHRAVEERRREAHTSTVRELRGRIQALEGVLTAVPRHEYGSVTPGIAEWRDKWARSAGRRVLFYAKKDFAGAMLAWARAINDHTDFAARLVALQAHEYGYDVDLLLPQPDPMQSDFLGLAAQADVIHIMDETGFLDGSNGLPADVFSRFHKPTVFTQGGGLARRHRDDPEYQRMVLGMAARVATTPDLVFPWFDGYYVPSAIDTDRFSYTWTDGTVVGHSPSDTARKGTDDLVEAVRRLADSMEIEFELIHGVNHDECLRRKQRVNVFFDQAGRESADNLGTDRVIGWYGVAALEAAVHGIPTIAHLSEDAFAGAERGGIDIRDMCAVINTPLGADGIEATLRSYFEMEPGERSALSHRTRAWIEGFHSAETVARRLAAVYHTL